MSFRQVTATGFGDHLFSVAYSLTHSTSRKESPLAETRLEILSQGGTTWKYSDTEMCIKEFMQYHLQVKNWKQSPCVEEVTKCLKVLGGTPVWNWVACVLELVSQSQEEGVVWD